MSADFEIEKYKGYQIKSLSSYMTAYYFVEELGRIKSQRMSIRQVKNLINKALKEGKLQPREGL